MKLEYIHHMQHDISQDACKKQRWLSYHVFKGNYTYDTQELQEPAQKGKHTPSSPRKRAKVAWSSGLVKMSASWSWVET